MLRYVIKRLLLFVPTLLVVSWIAFGLSRLAPGDPVMQYLVNDPFASVSSPADLLQAERACRQAAQTLRLDRPPFYFSVTTAARPDTLYRIVVGFRRKTLENLIDRFGNWPLIQLWYQGLRSCELAWLAAPDSLRGLTASLKPLLRELYTTAEPATIEIQLRRLDSLARSSPLQADVAALQQRWQSLLTQATPWKNYLPAVYWHGFDNQYHAWFRHFLRGDFGVSLYERLPVARKVKPALFWTLTMNILALALAFALAIPLGVLSAVKKGSRTDRLISLGLFSLYSLPAFWVGTMLLVFFATPTYGMKLFAGPGLGPISSGASAWEQWMVAAPHLVLPVLCLTYPALAFITRQVRGSMIEALGQDYVRTARAKGLPERTVIWKHAFRNARFPVITMLASVFPASIAGSVAIEFIFNIPGMGWLTLQAILQHDWPVVFTVLMLGAILTIIGMLVADVLYAISDPRVRL